MYYLTCIFDHNSQPPSPLLAAVYDDDDGNLDFYDLYLKGTGIKLYEVEQNKKALQDIIENYKVVLTNFKSFVGAFDLNIFKEYDVYEAPITTVRIRTTEYKDLQKLLLLRLKEIRKEPQKWQKILANAQLVYRHLELLGYYNNYKKCKPIYDFTYSGRSKSTQDNIQGASVKDDIKHSNPAYNTFVCFDWKAADLRVASLLSKDQRLQQSFINSDPYTALRDELDDDEITRDHCKMALFRSLYSLDFENPILECYDRFADWMKDSLDSINKVGYSKSMLGRKFYGIEGRTNKSVFNAQIQGSVAHAMQCVLYRVFNIYPDNLIADIHDSLVLAAKKDDIDEIIETVSQIMLYPFDGILEDNPGFPHKVCVGEKWKQWEEIREFRYGQKQA